MSVHNPHDKFFKETFSNIEVTKSFIEHYLPPDIAAYVNSNTLETQKDSFITKELEEFFSDLLFRVEINGSIGYLYLLLEHKSYPSPTVIFQLLQYMLEIWKNNQSEASKVPFVLPVVFFHSKHKWRAPIALSEHIENADDMPQELWAYVPDFEYILIGVSAEKSGKYTLRQYLEMKSRFSLL
ncbi:Rpn family recombination-promoting nuclease/putative transposase [Gracilibacillus marinus]|uniref:Rpn family recombination-promoting nuclease/putative transposase n=1 Tax=Gracilibacillus marinus TaxID=630535 RepID=A0ABV8VXN7_9BACI